MMSEKKNKKMALIGTILFAIVLLLILFLVNIRSIIQPKHEHVVELMDFLTEKGLFMPAQLTLSGKRTDAPVSAASSATSSLQPAPQALHNDDVITQNQEETVAIALAQERKRQEDEAIRRAVALAQGAFASSGTTGNETDNITGPNDNPAGSSSTSSVSGVVGGSPNLQSRFRSGDSPPPRYDINEGGMVVVEITVDTSGRVIRAIPGGAGTTTANQQLRNAARDAALKARFSPQEGTKSQTGTITYKFNLN